MKTHINIAFWRAADRITSMPRDFWYITFALLSRGDNGSYMRWLLLLQYERSLHSSKINN